MKKYNCWEEVKETFTHEMVFECEGEMFLMVDLHVSGVDFLDNFVSVNKTSYPNGVVISVVQNQACTQYLYRKVDFV